ncbi:transporter [Roseovarius sp. 2305UL8-3]|uniref:transporter n=1 Tax=Roseovarius conchicola TaxID=3121636 RepID=UPI003527A881
MTFKIFSALMLSAGLSVGATTAMAQSMETATMADHSGHEGHQMMDHAGMDHGAMGHAGHIPGPIGVMGDHAHKKGGVMLSYRFMRMDMAGNRIGSSNVPNDLIATTIPNSFFGMPGQPPTLRIVPTDMTMDMHMFGAMYAASDRVTLMAMVPYIEKSMNHLTYMGGAGTTVLGGFHTSTEGIGDVKVSALVGVMSQGNHKLNFNIGLSLPTGSITETGQVLTPMGMRPTIRLPYAMQLGSGTYDLMPGLTYMGHSGDFGYGAQLRGVIRLGSNDEGYSLGDEVAGSLWASYQPKPGFSLTGRIEAKSVGTIDGRDPLIMGPVQTADPLNYGGDTVTLYAGVNLVGQKGALRGHRFGIEAGVPVYQNLNGPQMETDWTLTLGWTKAF